MLRMPKEILVKSAKFAVRRPGVPAILGGTAATGLGIADAVLGGNPLHFITAISVGIGTVHVGIDVNRWFAKLTSINNRLDNIL